MNSEAPKIVVEEYNPQWPIVFEKLRSVYEAYLGTDVIAVHHVGSTSVPGLAAKPIIDIDLVNKDNQHLNALIEKLGQLGYQHMGNLGITDREAFKRISDQTPIDGSGDIWPKHNLYVCPENSISLKNHLALRDFLRNDPIAAREYGNLKKQLVANPYDIDRYVEAKTPFIIAILQKAGFDEGTLNRIISENKAGK